MKHGDKVIRVNTRNSEFTRACQTAGKLPSDVFIVEWVHNEAIKLSGIIKTWSVEYFSLYQETPLTSNKSEPTGVKHDLDKPRVDLLIDGCPKALEAISQVLTFGAKKYADHNWQKVPDGDLRYKAALMRHMLASASGSKLDEESGLSHLAHMACCSLFLLELELKKDE